MSKQKISVLIDIPLNCCFDYVAESSLNVNVGQRVIVPFGHQGERVGIVTTVSQLKEEEANKEESNPLKSVIAILESSSVVNAEWINLIQFASKYYNCPIGKVFKNASPNFLRKNRALIKPVVDWLEITDEGITAFNQNHLKGNAVKQKALLGLLQEQSIPKEVLSQKGFNMSHWQGLINKSYAYLDSRPVFLPCHQIKPPSYALNKHQNRVIDAINLESGFQSHLIYGITGSGKTEVYLQLIHKMFEIDSNKPFQVLVLVPEIALTPQMIDRFKERFGDQVGIYHSEISQTKKTDCFLVASSGDVSIVIGTRSAIFLPFNNLGLIIVDEEHDQSYKQEKSFMYHARDLAIYRANILNIPVILGSATPSLESIYNVEHQKMICHQLRHRATDATMPTIKMIDRRGEYKTQILSPKLEQAMRQTLYKNKQVMLFLNRRGYAPVLMCESCNWRSHCEQCSCYQTSHLKSQRLICHHCGKSSPLPKQCPSCYQDDLFFVGAGTEKLTEYLITQFPNYKILTIDRDTQTTVNKLAQTLKQIANNEVDIIIGTQMVVKGHHFPNVDMVGVVDADGGLFSPEFRAEEKLYQQLVQLSGRAGRESNTGSVYIQSQVPQHELFEALINKDYWEYAQTLLAQRKEYHLPPYYAFSQIVNVSKNYQDGITHLQQVREMIESHQNKVTIQGPVTMPLEKKENKYYTRLMVVAPQKKVMQKYTPLIQSILQHFDKLNKTKTTIDIDAM